jgi:hypothetical protein
LSPALSNAKGEYEMFKLCERVGRRRDRLAHMSEFIATWEREVAAGHNQCSPDGLPPMRERARKLAERLRHWEGQLSA